MSFVYGEGKLTTNLLKFLLDFLEKMGDSRADPRRIPMPLQNQNEVRAIGLRSGRSLPEPHVSRPREESRTELPSISGPTCQDIEPEVRGGPLPRTKEEKKSGPTCPDVGQTSKEVRGGPLPPDRGPEHRARRGAYIGPSRERCE